MSSPSKALAHCARKWDTDKKKVRYLVEEWKTRAVSPCHAMHELWAYCRRTVDALRLDLFIHK